MKSIIFIVPYYGTFPSWFQLWLNSCRQNPTIDWMVITDILTEKYSLPPNVKIVNYSFEELSRYIQQKYSDLKIELSSPYKLCDFRPAYGEIFCEYIVNYDYWGYCDVDLIWGNIRSFLTDDLLSKNYDKLFSLGHCTLYRNLPENNQTYRSIIPNIINYRQVFSSPKHFAFDERRGIVSIYKYLNKRTYDVIHCYDVEFRKYKFQPSSSMLHYYPELRKRIGVFRWNFGTVEYIYLEQEEIKKKEFMYVHFQKRIMSSCLLSRNETIYYMIPNKFISNIQLSKEEIIKKQPSGLYWTLLRSEFKQKLSILLHKQKVIPFYKGKVERILYAISLQK